MVLHLQLPGTLGMLPMTNRLALILTLLIVGLLVLDHQWLHWNLPLVVGRQFVRFVEYVSFWR